MTTDTGITLTTYKSPREDNDYAANNKQKYISISENNGQILPVRPINRKTSINTKV